MSGAGVRQAVTLEGPLSGVGSWVRRSGARGHIRYSSYCHVMTEIETGEGHRRPDTCERHRWM